MTEGARPGDCSRRSSRSAQPGRCKTQPGVLQARAAQSKTEKRLWWRVSTQKQLSGSVHTHTRQIHISIHRGYPLTTFTYAEADNTRIRDAYACAREERYRDKDTRKADRAAHISTHAQTNTLTCISLTGAYKKRQREKEEPRT